MIRFRGIFLQRPSGRRFLASLSGGLTLDKFQEIIQPSLAPILSSLEVPHLRTTKDSERIRKNIEVSFNKKLEYNIKNYIENSGNGEFGEISAHSYIDPRLNEIAPLVLHLQSSTSPPIAISKLLQVDNTKSEILLAVLSCLLQKEILKANLVSFQLDDNNKIDFSNPAEWYPEARKMRRKFILHVGPTNSGKTYNALKLLETAKSGYYAGPLRLLAREIYETYRKKGISCNLITGEEIIPDLDEFGNVARISSGTIEMVPVNRKMDICIIDEIQMISDNRRGEAWTNAVLGVQAKEVHLCGEELAVNLIKKIAAITGDEVVVNRYKRLGKLVVEKKPINFSSSDKNKFKALRKGDCIVAFLKLKILKLKKDIEASNQWKVGIVYGALPPEVRSEEANKFNSGEYDILVASDAIGMGLNLKINRIIFADSEKFDGSKMSPLTVSQVKQIAGRAGRYQSDGELIGYVNAIGGGNLRLINKRMQQDAKSLTQAYLWPTPQIWSKYIASFPEGTTMLEVINKFDQDFRSSKFNENKDELYDITELDTRRLILEKFLESGINGKLTADDQLRLSIAPINLKRASEFTKDIVERYLKNICNSKSLDIIQLRVNDPVVMKNDPSPLMSYESAISVVGKLEELHKLTLLFLWLSQRWPTLFTEKEGATDLKSLIEKRITEELANLKRIKRIRRDTRHKK